MVGHASERHRKRTSEVGDTSKKEEVIEVDKLEEVDKPKEVRSEVKESKESSPEVEIRLQDAMKELKVQENKEDNISQKMEEALGELREMESKKETNESKIKEAIDSLEEPVNDDEPQLRTKKGSKYDDLIDYEIRLDSKERFDEALENYPETELRKDFIEKYNNVETYYDELEQGENSNKPELVDEIENLEVRRKYEEVNGGPPDVQLESMKDVDDLLEKYSGQISESKQAYAQARTYFQIRNESGKNQHQLAQEYGCSQSKISNIRRGVETNLIKELRMREEERIIQEWCESRKLGVDLGESSDYPNGSAKGELSIDDSKHHKIQENVIRESFHTIKESKEITRTTLENAIENMIQSSADMDSRVRMSDLSESGLTSDELAKIREVLESNRNEIQDTLKHKVNLEKICIGMIDDRLYIWTPNMTPNDMINAWHDQYFYVNSRDMAKIADESGSRLELGDSRRERLRNLNDLINQMINDGQSSNVIKIDGNRSRMPGEALHIQRDVLGIRNRDLEGRVTKVTGINGHGGIVNPKFPEGQKLEAWRAGLIGAALSDCHIRTDDSIVEYYEENLERLHRFRESLKEVGDFTNEPTYDARGNLYRLKLPSPYGRALNYWGIPSGDKAIKNPELPSDYRRWSPEAKCEYSSEMTSEESNISSGRCIWPRSNVIKAGEKKSDVYRFKSRISKKEIDLIKDKGRTRSGDFEGQKTIPYGLIDDLKRDNNPDVAKTAQQLEDTISINRNRLIDSERNLYSDLGIEITVAPRAITYYEMSGRVSVKWEARTSNSSATIRLGIMCPPNHPAKEVVLKSWMDTRKPEKIQSVLEDIENGGFVIPEEWTTNKTKEIGD
ncbi:MAG: hypothetical protein ACTSWA_00700 [Candidatus Thorarchaeota archaeon]